MPMHKTGREHDHRTQETPKAASFAIIPRKRYRGIDHRGHLATLGQGCTTGHQNRIEVAKKHTCSTSCQKSERRANSKAVGECHPIKVTVAASQQNTGWVRSASQRLHWRPAQNGPKEPRTNLCGSPCKKRQGRRSQQNQGRSYGHEENVLHHVDRKQIIIKSCERRSDAIQRASRPLMKQFSRHIDAMFGRRLRRRCQPRK